MTDTTVVHIGENSPEQVALKLLEIIAANERKHLLGNVANTDREWVLRTYAQCISTVRTPGAIEDHLKK